MHTMGSWLTTSRRGYRTSDITAAVSSTIPSRVSPAIEPRSCSAARELQPHSGANANVAAFMAMCDPGDRILSLLIKSGGHLSHGLSRTSRGPSTTSSSTTLVETEQLDYDGRIDRQGVHMIIWGIPHPASSISRLRRIADEVGAVLMADINIAGLVAAGVHPSPFPHTDVVTRDRTRRSRPAAPDSHQR